SVELTWVDPDDLDAWKRAARPHTKAFFAESIGNPAGHVLDLEAVAALAHGACNAVDIEPVAAIAHEHQAPLLVDNTFATPYLCRPIEWGADIVLHAATKFIGGQGTSICGGAVGAGTLHW